MAKERHFLLNSVNSRLHIYLSIDENKCNSLKKYLQKVQCDVSLFTLAPPRYDMNLEDLFKITFTSRLQEDLVEALQNAYGVNMPLHDESIGHDAASFGFLNYKTKTFNLKNLATDNPEIAISRSAPYLSLRVGDFLLSAYNAGDASMVDDLMQCFPRNQNRAPEVTRENVIQLKLDLNIPDEFDVSDCRHLLLCDVGDPTNGLAAVFIGVPVQTEKGKISRWGAQWELWRRPGIDFGPDFAPIQPVGPVAPVESNQPLILTRKPQRKVETNNA
jgi:hypothetical protein